MPRGRHARDVVDVLTEDHREVEDLLAQIKSAGDAGRRRELADIVIAELIRHSVAEEMHVYPVMREHLPDGEEAVQHDTEEHKEIERALKELESADSSGPEFSRLVEDLTAMLRDHVSDEENEQFPKLRSSVPDDELAAMAENVATAKKMAPTRPHPGSPHSEGFHKLAGPGVGLVDRLRDRLAGRATG